MSYKSHDFVCPECGHHVIELIPRDADILQFTVKCKMCDTTMQRVIGAPMVMRASYPDGTRRFDGIRLTQKLRRAKQEARARGDRKLEAEVKRDMESLKK